MSEYKIAMLHRKNVLLYKHILLNLIILSGDKILVIFKRRQPAVLNVFFFLKRAGLKLKSESYNISRCEDNRLN